MRRRDQDVDYFKWTQVCTQAALNGWSFCGFLLVDCECRGVWVSSPRLPAEWARTLPHQRSLFTPTALPERSTSSTRSTSAISGTIVPSSTRPHRQAQHIPRSPKREVCVRKCWRRGNCVREAAPPPLGRFSLPYSTNHTCQTLLLRPSSPPSWELVGETFKRRCTSSPFNSQQSRTCLPP